MKVFCLIVLTYILIFQGVVQSDEAPIKFTKAINVVKGDSGSYKIEFSLSKASDVEVSILNAKSEVVNHLAAGKIGAEITPPQPLVKGLEQKLVWDGKDDFGKEATAGPFQVRVRVGMDVQLEKIAGGDPYAFLSDDMDQHNHTAWQMNGMIQKDDGLVYVLGNSTFLGPAVIRAYDSEGVYVKTVFPPPANLPIDKVKGWDVFDNKDGTYTPKVATTNSPSLSRTTMASDRLNGGLPWLMDSPEKDKLYVQKNYGLLTIGTDGSCQSNERKNLSIAPALGPGQNVKGDEDVSLGGPYFYSYSSDKKWLYFTGVYAGKRSSGAIRGLNPDSFWRDGCLWKMEVATGKTDVFYSIDKKKVIVDLGDRVSSSIGSNSGSYAAFHGVAVDGQNRVFLCDRQNEQILIFDSGGKILRKIPIKFPDAIAVSPVDNSIYVTVRAFGLEAKEDAFQRNWTSGNISRGLVKLLKFNNWEADEKPSISIDLCYVGYEYSYGGKSLLLVTKNKDGKGVNVWVSYHTLPLQIYKDADGKLEKTKDFLEVSKQACLDMQRIAVDNKTETVFVADGFGSTFRLNDWSNPQFKRCLDETKKPIKGSSVAVDPIRRYVYFQSKGDGLSWSGPIRRFKMDSDLLGIGKIGSGNNEITEHSMSVAWHITWGNGDRGFSVGPDGNIATLDPTPTLEDKHNYVTGQLRIFKKADTAPWLPIVFPFKGDLGGIRFDPKGNIYVGQLVRNKKAKGKKDSLSEKEADKLFQRTMGNIVKFSPTGSLESGDLYPSPGKVVKEYDISLGAYGVRWFRTPRFGVDGWGRIYYPTSLLQKVTMIDNEGAEIMTFGTWGNRDSFGGLEGDLVPTKGVPMAYPNSVDVTDDYIYVGDMGNCRLLRLKKIFILNEVSALP